MPKVNIYILGGSFWISGTDHAEEESGFGLVVGSMWISHVHTVIYTCKGCSIERMLIIMF